MSKVITLRLSDDEYKKISNYAKFTHRPISNFITHSVLKKLEESEFVDPIEMEQIINDEELQKSLKSGHQDVKKRRGRFVE